MKKILNIVLLLFVFLLFGCQNNMVDETKLVELNIINLPDKLEYNIDEPLDLSGLTLEAKYSDDTTKIIDDYKVESNELTYGQNIIKLEYLGITTEFTITVKQLEKIDLLLYSDYLAKINSNFTINSYNMMFENVAYGGYRGTDTMIVYDKDKYVDTNLYGYEVLVDEYGYVVDLNKKVDLKGNGYVISGHGTKAAALKEVELGDYVIYLDNRIFIYEASKEIEENKVFIKFLQIIDKLNKINDIVVYNKVVGLLNQQIPLLEDLFDNYNNLTALNVNNDLDTINNLIVIEDVVHHHTYSYLSTSYEKIPQSTPNENNYILHATYSEKLYYGGFRNANTLVHYDESNIRNRNEYGYEVAVGEDNIIIDIDVLVDLPNGGYILSGHGSGADFIKEHLSIGDIVEIKDNVINFYHDMLVTIINELINYRNDIINLVVEEDNNSIPHDYKYISEVINNIDKELNELIESISKGVIHYNMYHKYETIKDYISIAYSQLIDYNINTSRAMWYYPFEYPHLYDDTTLKGVENTLDKFKSMGFNEIIILPFYEQYILYDSNYFYKSSALSNYQYGSYGDDYLSCFISEAHKRGILVNAFTQTFRCFYEGSKLLTEEHYQIDFQGEYSYGSVHYYDICNDYVQDVLYNWYIELITKYNFDKIEYDIIRYPSSNLYKNLDVDIITSSSPITDHGYTTYSMNKFMTKYNLSGDLRDLILNNKEIRLKWLEFKEEELINFITKTTNGIKSIRPNTKVSAAVMSNLSTAQQSYLQDFKKWLELGIVDQVEPMVYSQSNSFVFEHVVNYQTILKDLNYRIGIGYDLHTIDLMIQIKHSEEVGFVLFNASDYLTKDFYKLLSSNHHFNNVNINNNEETYYVIKNDVIDKIENYYEIKYNTDFDYLIDLLRSNDLIKLKEELHNLEYSHMSNYLLNVFETFFS